MSSRRRRRRARIRRSGFCSPRSAPEPQGRLKRSSGIWKIEDFFRVLKSGCRAESQLFRKAERLRRALAVNAWRIMAMTLPGRQIPECGPGRMLADEELRFLESCAEQHGLARPETLGAAVCAAAHFGGYQDRKHDPEPGHQIMRRGQTQLTSAVVGRRTGYQAGYEAAG